MIHEEAWRRAQDRELAKIRRIIRWKKFWCNVRLVYFHLRLRWVRVEKWMVGE